MSMLVLSDMLIHEAKTEAGKLNSSWVIKQV